MSESKRKFDRDVGNELRLLRRHLQVVHGGIVVAAAALRRQNADRDKEIAQVLEQLVGERLADQVKRTSRLLAIMEASQSRPIGIDAFDGEGDGPQGVREACLVYLPPPPANVLQVA